MNTLLRVSTALLSALLLLAGCENGGGGIDGGDDPVAVSGVSLDKTYLTLTVGDSETLTANVLPPNADNKGVTWRSSFSAIASVDSSGKVTALRAGKATVTAVTADGSYTATCDVTVVTGNVAVTGVSISRTTADIEMGGDITLSATVIPSGATNKKADWSSANTAVATVNAAGKVTAVSVGETSVTITTQDGAKTASCRVTVTAADPLNLLNAAHIPDPVFLEYCREQMANWDDNDDGKLYADEAAAVRVIDVANAYGNAISSLRGIEYFTGITYLDCSQNNLASLDVSRCTQLTELNCNNNSRLSSLVISEYSRLTSLNCSACMLSRLDVSKCTRLVELRCYFNELASLDVSACTALNVLDVDRNRLTSLDLSRNRALNRLICSNNLLTSLNLSQCAELSDLQVDGNQFASLNLSSNAKLLLLNCNMNLLTSLDISRNTVLRSLICDGNRLASITVGPGNSQLELVRNSSNNLSATALNDIFENLPYSGTIALSNNPGTTTCDIKIIKDKNWIVQSD